MKRLLMTGNAIVRYVREDEPEDIPDYCSKVKLYLTDEKTLILVFKMVFPHVEIDEPANIHLWDPFQMRMKVPWNESAIKIADRDLILTFNMHRYSVTNPTNYEVYARLEGEITGNIPDCAFIDLSVKSGAKIGGETN
jgi:hypothetical protein